jgi:hypothetical protein
LEAAAAKAAEETAAAEAAAAAETAAVMKGKEAATAKADELAAAAPPPLTAAARSRWVKAAWVLAGFTAVYNLGEGGVAITLGVADEVRRASTAAAAPPPPPSPFNQAQPESWQCGSLVITNCHRDATTVDCAAAVGCALRLWVRLAPGGSINHAPLYI